jgi:hypothetical protein
MLASWRSLLVLFLSFCGSGCRWCGPCGPCGYMSCSSPVVGGDCDACEGPCDGSCDTACGQFPRSCGTCLPGVRGGFSGLMLPLLSTRLACGSGCGDVYWGEWIYNPPECCDACNEDGCWAGSSCDGSYGPCGGCGSCLLAGPGAVLRGTYLGVTGVVRGAFSLLNCGYCNAFQAYPAQCGYGYCPDACDSPACGACGSPTCSGDCAAVQRRSTAPVAASRPVAGVRTARVPRGHAGSAAGSSVQRTSRVVNSRLRR